MKNIRVKICGITRIEDAIAAAEAGADAIGLVFYPQSKRYISPALAREIAGKLPPFVTKVGLFVNSPRESVKCIIDEACLDLLQFHGDETEQDCNAYRLPYIKAVKMYDGIDLKKRVKEYPGAAGILVDSCVEGMVGGTGKTFDWTLIGQEITRPIILAGGLNAGNVSKAIQIARPYAVDVSGGVELEPGIKDHDKINIFINEVRKSV